jgi:hypothetical protein
MNTVPPPDPSKRVRIGYTDPSDRFEVERARLPWWVKMIIVITIAVVGGAWAVQANETNHDSDDGGRRYTLVEAACKSLREGRDREFVYAVMKRLAADHPLVYGEDEAVAARAAVAQAEAQGGGR